MRPLSLSVLLVAPTIAAGQVVHGTVSEQRSLQPLAGVVVSLEPLDTTRAPSRQLTVDDGRYRLVADGPGRYRVSAKRIGVARFVSGVFELAAGEAHALDIALATIAQVLPEVRIEDADLCVPESTDRPRIVMLWEEARTALLAAGLSLRDSLYEGQLTRYARSLEPRGLRVVEESWGEWQGVIERPFGVLDGDSLSRLGYRHEAGGVTWYHALDATVLLSRAFQRDHCLGLRAGHGALGVTFSPAPVRRLPDVAGTVWIDARTFELRFVEYRYTGIGTFPGSDRVGGEVHFTRLESGAWMTSRWFTRVPAGAYLLTPVDALSRLPVVILRPADALLHEEGGIVQVERRRP